MYPLYTSMKESIQNRGAQFEEEHPLGTAILYLSILFVITFALVLLL